MLIDHNSNWLGKVTQQTNQYNHFPSEYTAGVGEIKEPYIIFKYNNYITFCNEVG